MTDSKEQSENPAILFVDDEEKALKYFKMKYENDFKVYTANRADEAYDILESKHEDIGVLVTDHKMPGQKGVELMAEVRERYPDIVRVLTTAHLEVDVAMEAINQGEAYRMVKKPWGGFEELTATLKEGRTKYVVQKKEKALIREKSNLLNKVGMIDHSDCLSTLAIWAGLNVRNALVPVKKFINSIPRRLEQENLDIQKLQNLDFWGETLNNVSHQIDLTNMLLTDLYAMSQKGGYHFVDKVSFHQIVATTISKLGEELKEHGLEVDNQIDPDLPPLILDHPKAARLIELILKRRMRELQNGGSIVFRARLWFESDWGPGEMLQVMIEEKRSEFARPSTYATSAQFYDQEAADAECGLCLLISHLIVYYHGGKMERLFHDGKNEELIMALPLSPAQPSIPN